MSSKNKFKSAFVYGIRVAARFESERQTLALMDHPVIAKALDAGSTEQGAPYFVMEYVNGIPITKYCDRHRLTPEQRLELFMRVCEGVPRKKAGAAPRDPV